ncbi:MAG: glycosyltransferase family 9 protein [Planctomycetes bacterium]|nr:glycosyltransferase family 9 protein [Planctomycetota bacterium]
MTAVLFVRLSAMGDLVHGLGAMAALHHARPDWPLALVTQPEFVPLLHGLPVPLRVVTFDRRGGLAALWRLGRELRRLRPDVALDLQGNWKSALVARLSGAPRRLGMASSWRQEPASRWLLTATVVGAGLPHPAKAATKLVQALAPEVAFAPPALVAAQAELQQERVAIEHLGIDWRRPFVVVVLTDPADPRALRPAVVQELSRRHAGRVLLVVGPAEAGVPVPAGAAVLRHARGELRRLVALGAIVAAAGGLVLGPDQGATHVLAATGARTRVAYGPQDPQRTAPPAATVVVHALAPACRPCRSRRCHHEAGPVCMDFDPEAGRMLDVTWSAPA